MENQASSNGEFATTDVYLAAYFHSSGENVSFVRIEKRDPQSRKLHFVFGGEKELFDKLKAGFFNYTATVRAGSYAASIKLLKQMCFSDVPS